MQIDVRDTDSISGSGRSPGEGHGNLLQYSGLENSMDRAAGRATVSRVAESRTRLKQSGAALHSGSLSGTCAALCLRLWHLPPGLHGTPAAHRLPAHLVRRSTLPPGACAHLLESYSIGLALLISIISQLCSTSSSGSFLFDYFTHETVRSFTPETTAYSHTSC